MYPTETDRFLLHWLVQEEGWVVCRAFRKPTPNPRPCYNTTYGSIYIRDYDQCALERLPAGDALPTRIMESNPGVNFYGQPFGFEGEHDPKLNCSVSDIHVLDSPNALTNLAANSMSNKRENSGQTDDSRGPIFVDWRDLGKFASQLSESAFCSNSNLPNFPLEYDINDPNYQGDQFASFFRC